MSHRTHLFSLRLGHAFMDACVSSPYGRRQVSRDLLAGLTVGIIAIPLSMALAIASGVAPQYGLYTAIVAGIVIALTGGCRYSISGPTAAFVVLLAPISQQYGLTGLLVATMMSGLILIIMALLRLGRLIQYIPESVTLGFTSGIAVVIATLQLNDFFGLNLSELPHGFGQKVVSLATALPQLHLPSLAVGALTLVVMLLWPRLKLPVPAHLPAVLLATLVCWWLNQAGMGIETIGSRFHYLNADGSLGQGIPPVPPTLDWPWHRGGDETAISWSLIQSLLPSAMAIAMLGAIESLLCAVVVDGMTNSRHSANSELLGQGIGNLIAPLFGGIPATAAIARSAANVKAGAISPVSAVVHSLLVLLALLGLSKALSYLPMPAMAALLLVVAWNMSEAPKALALMRRAPGSDVLVLLCCFLLTVAFDMVVAISAGMVLAALLFMKEIAEMTRLHDLSDNRRYVEQPLPADWIALKINGPLFFAAADRIFAEIRLQSRGKTGVILFMNGVSVLDAGGLSALNRLVEECRLNGTRLVITDLQFQPMKALAKAGVSPIDGVLTFMPVLSDAVNAACATRR
ncbi:C4-dicarboxylic acid transporter DauA [Ferrimonas sp. SCSIO 43195]|uniref:C4-dicarboxylic acid transporter DauA n=1 Tax=Ferrimonas sp. SCSIO 43195 TaxID=2822844 RepID=UPI002075034A|nr:C4-dicarboxylic acid transporter DauA [Ferrimonas sp. SCSIO 43195]USD35673.1 C4-dicarboxylic acid transporter DauA [Ferrimonas sp. SCSIO 43195]